MLNKAPIFVNAFWRGGSNILVNLLLSHPDVCTPTGELQQVFRGRALFRLAAAGRSTRTETRSRILYKRLRYKLPVDVVGGPRFLKVNNLDPRRDLPTRIKRHIDRVLFFENGLVFLTDLFASMYPDATFFGLVRNGFALCEGFVRRGHSPESCARTYVRVVEKMLADAERLERYHIVRFDDVLRNPAAAARHLYRLADLDAAKVDRIRLQHKATLDQSGKHHLGGGSDRELAWYDWDRLFSHLRSDIDAVQASRLNAENRERFLTIAGPVMQRLGYQ